MLHITPKFDIDFERGIESLDRTSAAPDRLPEGASLRPVDSSSAPLVDALLYPLAIDGYLRTELMPVLNDAMLLRPGPFQEALRTASTLLTSNESVPAEIGARAKAVLDREIALQDLSGYLRNALHEA